VDDAKPEPLAHSGQAIGWYRCDGQDCPLCGRTSEPANPPPEDPATHYLWSEWPGILAESIRTILDSQEHAHAMRDAAYALKCYDEQVKTFGPMRSLPERRKTEPSGTLNHTFRRHPGATHVRRGDKS